MLPGFKKYFFFLELVHDDVCFINTSSCFLWVKQNSNPVSVQEIILNFLSLAAV